MNTNTVNVAVIDGKTITETTELKVSSSGKPIRIKAVENGKYVLAEGDKGVAPENITVKRVGKDLHVALEGTDPDQPQLIIEGFFDAQGQLVGVAEDGAYYEYISSDAEQDHSAAFLIDGVSSPQVLGAEPLIGFGDGLVAGGGMGWFGPAMLGLAGVGLLGAAYAASDDDDDDNGSGNDNGGGGGSTTPPNTPTLNEASDNVGDKTGKIESGGVTDDSTPTFSGVGTPGNTIIIKDGDDVLGEVIVGEDGTWEFTPETPLDGGSHEIIVVEKDPQGNESEPSDGFEFTVDLTAPNKAVITDAQDDFGDQTGTVAQHGVTDDNTPTLKGTAEPGSTVEIFANGVKIGEAPVNPDGTWSFTPNPALKDGEYSFTSVAVDAAGNRGLASDPYVLTIDTDGIAVEISITGAMDDVGTILDPLSSGGVTDDTTPTLNGKATPNSTVTIYQDGIPIGTTTSDSSGNWSYEVPALEDGEYNFTATVTTEAGGESAHTAEFNLEIDTTAPGKPGEGGSGSGGIDTVTDDFGDIRGPIENGGSTDDTTPTLGGGGLQPGDTVTIKDGDTVLDTVIVDEDGNWSYTPNPPLEEGQHDFTIIVTDPAGNASEASDPFTVIVDTIEPAKPAITSVVDDQGDVTGDITAGGTTDDARPDIKGTAEPGSTVIIYDNGEEIDRVTAGPDGNWTYQPTPPLTNGSHSLTVAAMDAAGNVSPQSDPFEFDVLAGGVPTAPAITGITDDFGNQTGNLSPGDVTDDARPTIQGTGQPGSIITVYANGVPLGTTEVADNGQWSFPVPSDLDEGLNNITAIATDAAGIISPETGSYPITVDTAEPDSASGQVLMDDVGTLIGQINNGDTTDDNTPTFSGTAEPGSTVIIYDNGEPIDRVPVDEHGNWSFTPSTPLEEGPHSFSTIVEDAAGNQSAMSPATDFIVDTSAVEISIINVTDNVGTIQDPLSSGGVTDDTTPTLHGQATPNSTVTIYQDGIPIDTTTSDPSGNWSYEVPALEDGEYSFTATVTPAAGAESAHTAEFNLEIDTTKPDKPGEGSGGIDAVLDDVGDHQDPIANGGSTDDTTPTLVGSGLQPGDKVTIYDGEDKIGEEIVEEDGTWSHTPNPPLNEGPHEFTVIVTDPAGNASEASDPYTVIVDTIEPAKPAITSVVDDQGDVTGDITAGGTTDDAQPDISGTAEPGSTVIIYDNGVEIGREPVDEHGNWTYQPTPPLDNISHSLTVAAMDAAGNVGPQSDPFNFEVIAGGAPTAPAITGITDDFGNQTGNLSPGDVTDDVRPTIQGTGQPGNIITVYANGEPLGTVEVQPDGQWSFPVPSDLDEGLNNITATATNEAGNISPETGSYPITVDTTKPDSADGQVLMDDVGPVVPINNGDTTDDNTPTFSGTAEPHSTVIIYDNGEPIDRVPVDEHGNWSFTPSMPLEDGEHSFSTIVEDTAGNQSAMSPATDFIVDTSAVEISITNATDNVGTILDPLRSGDVTDDTTPTLHGKATMNSTVTIYKDGIAIGTTTSDSFGNWSYEVPAQEDGEYSFTATVTPAAGVESAHTAEFNLEIDTTKPDKPGAGSGGIDTVLDDVGDHQDPIANGGSTDDTTPTLVGSGLQPGDKVTIYDGEDIIGEEIVEEDGTWSHTPNPPLNDGRHDFTVIVTDPAGNASEASDPYTVIVDTRIAAPSINRLHDNVGVAEDIPNGGSTDDRRPTLFGEAEPFSDVTVYIDGAPVATVQANELGEWTYDVTTDLSGGDHSIYVIAEDAAGNSEQSASWDVTVTGSTSGGGTRYEDWDNVGGFEIFNVGTRHTFGSGLKVELIIDGPTDNFDNGIINTTNSSHGSILNLTKGSAVRIDFGSTETFSLEYGSNVGFESEPLVVKIYSPDGTYIDEIEGASTSSLKDFETLEYSAPDGVEIGYIEVFAGHTVYIDDVLWGPRTPTINFEDWDNASTGPMAVGTVYDFGSGLEVELIIDGPTDNFDNGIVNTTNSSHGSILNLTKGSAVRIDFGSTEAFSLEYGSNGGLGGEPLVVKIYSPDGTYIDEIEGAGTSSLKDFETLEYSAPDGVEIGYIEVFAGHTVYIDDVVWGQIDVPPAPAPAPAVETRYEDWDNANISGARHYFNTGVAYDFGSGLKVELIIDGPTDNFDNGIINTTNSSHGSILNLTKGSAVRIDFGSTETFSLEYGSNVGFESEPLVVKIYSPDGTYIDEIEGASTSSLKDFETLEYSAPDGVEIGYIEVFAGHTVYIDDVLWGPRTPTINFEDWDNASTGPMAVGTVYDFGSGLEVELIIDGPTDNFDNGIVNTTNSNHGSILNLTKGSAVRIDFGSTEAFSLEYGSNGGLGGEPLVVKIYSPDGTYIDEIEGAGTSSLKDFETLEYSAPDGVEIGYIEVFAGHTVYIDDVVWGTAPMDHAPVDDVLSPYGQAITAEGTYSGDDGNDVFSVADVSLLNGAESQLSGNGGLDTLKLTGANQVLDLTALGDKLSSIETIDLTGSGDNTLKLSLDDVLNQGGTDLFHDSGKTQMMVNGNEGDEVDLQGLIEGEDPGSWGAQGQVTVGGVVYEVYSHSSLDAELLVQQGVTTNLV